MDQMRMPGGFRQVGRQYPYFFRRRGTAPDAGVQAGVPHQALSWLFHQRRALPDAGVAWHFGHVPLAQRRDFVQKSRVFPKTLVKSHPLEGNHPALIHFLQHIQCQLPLGLKSYAFRQTAGLSQQTVICIKPLLRNIQSLVQETITSPTDISQENPFLTIRNLTKMPAILPRHSHRMLPLFRKAASVHNDNPIMLTHPGSHLGLQLDHRFACVPFTLTHEALQISDSVGDRTQQCQDHGFNRLSFQVGQLPAQVKP